MSEDDDDDWLLLGKYSVGRWLIAYWLDLRSGEIVINVSDPDPGDGTVAANDNWLLAEVAA